MRRAVIPLLVVLGLLATTGFSAEPKGTAETVRPALSKRYPRAASLIHSSHEIPGLDTGYVPQGIAFEPSRRWIVISEYHDEGTKASVLQFLDARTGAHRGTGHLTHERRAMQGHVGGIACCAGFLWVASEGRLFRFPLPVSLAAHEVTFEADRVYEVDSAATSLSCEGKCLWVGEFSLGNQYRTEPHHRLRGQSCWAAAYNVTDQGELGASETYRVGDRNVLKPDCVVGLHEKVQGFAFCGEFAVLSQSYGSADSLLEFFQSPLREKSFTVELPQGKRTEGYELQRKSLAGSLPLPAGAEDLEWTGEHLLIPFESGAAKYRTRWGLMGALVEDRFWLLTPPRF